MTRSAFGKRLTGVYDIETRQRVARYEGSTTPAARLESKWLRLRFQFLPHYFSEVPRWRLRLRSLRGPRTYPDFACIGALKCGTSDLATYLFQHPSILPPLSKEVTSRNPDDWLPYFPTIKEKERVAREHGKALSGQFTPALSSAPFMEAFRRVQPRAKVILMLRNPTERAYSHYKFDLLLAGKTLLKDPHYETFTAWAEFALESFPGVAFESRSRYEILRTGIYVQAVDMWLKTFGHENLHILRAEDFFDDVVSTVCNIHQFLGLAPRRPELHAIVNQNPIAAPPLEAETRKKLKAFYRPWNEKLYALIGRDMRWD